MAHPVHVCPNPSEWQHHCGCRNLAGKDLGGSLPQDASAYTPLTTLTLLDLSTNQLTGSLPPLGSLTALQTLELMENSFTGPLPELSGFRNLTVINFQDNQFSGKHSFIDLLQYWQVHATPCCYPFDLHNCS